MLWVQNSGKPEHFEDFAFGGAEPFLNRHICSDHFYDEDFVDADDKSLGLLPESVPHLNSPASHVDIKEECLDPEYTADLKGTSNSEFPIQIKLESPEINDVNANLSFSSNNDSGNDFHTNRDSLDESDAEEIKLSDDFFRDYNDAMRRNRRRGNESEKARLKRLKREAMKARERRSKESEEQSRLRRMKNALRAAFRRKNETPEQREARRMKDNTRAQVKRKGETEIEASIRRHNDAVRAANRRKNETSEEKRNRRMKDTLRAAKRRSMETPEQRQLRLFKDRERASKKRMFKKIFEQMERLSDANDVFPAPPTYVDVKGDDGVEYETDDTIPITITSLPSAVRHCTPGSSYERLQEVLNFVSKRVRLKGRSNIDSSKDAKSFSAVVVEAGEDNINGDDHDVYNTEDSHHQHNIQHFLSWNDVNQQPAIEECVPEDTSENVSVVQSVQQCSMDKNSTFDETEINGDLR